MVEQQKQAVKPVVKGKTTVKKKSGFEKFWNQVVVGNAKDIGGHVLNDILIPEIKKTISDMATNTINMLLYGESGGAKSNNSGSKVSYRSYYDNPKHTERKSYYSVFDYDLLYFDSELDASLVLETMTDILDSYDFVTVADYYETANVKTGTEANGYGWARLSKVEVKRSRDGWYLDLPKPIPRNR